MKFYRPQSQWLRYAYLITCIVLMVYFAWSWLDTSTVWHRHYVVSRHMLKILKQRKTPTPGNSPALSSVHRECNPIDGIKAGSEGSPAADRRLLAVLLLVRHGDRGPLLPDVRNLSAIDCGGPTQLDVRLRRLYRNYTWLAAGRAGRAAWRAPLGAFSRTPLLPDRHACAAGRLTRRGVLQLLRLGDALRARYDRVLAGPLHVFFTPFERTFQSAGALAFGLAGDAALVRARWRVTRDPDLCLADCACAAARRLQTRTGLERRRLLGAHPAAAQLAAHVGALLVERQAAAPPLAPAEVKDSLLAFVCHGAPLPCRADQCVTPADATAVVAFTRWERRQRRGDDWLRAARLRTRGFFRELDRLLRLVASRAAGAPALALFAAHDLTLNAVLRALGLRSLDVHLQPPYAARLAIEVYEPAAAGEARQSWSPAGQLGFRLVYNGDDVTRLLPMCTDSADFGYDLCPLRVLTSFTGPHYLDLFNVSTYEQACE